MPIKNRGITFQSWKSSSKIFFYERTIFFTNQHFYTLSSIAFAKSTMFNFCRFPLPNKVFCTLYKKSVILLWSLVINKRCLTLETAYDLKTVILPSKINCLMRNSFKMFYILTICSQKVLSCSRFLLCDKLTPSIFAIKINRFHPTECYLNPIRTPIPVISHFSLLNFKKYLTDSLIL